MIILYCNNYQLLCYMFQCIKAMLSYTQIPVTPIHASKEGNALPCQKQKLSVNHVLMDTLVMEKTVSQIQR